MTFTLYCIIIVWCVPFLMLRLVTINCHLKSVNLITYPFSHIIITCYLHDSLIEFNDNLIPYLHSDITVSPLTDGSSMKFPTKWTNKPKKSKNYSSVSQNSCLLHEFRPILFKGSLFKYCVNNINGKFTLFNNTRASRIFMIFYSVKLCCNYYRVCSVFRSCEVSAPAQPTTVLYYTVKTIAKYNMQIYLDP